MPILCSCGSAVPVTGKDKQKCPSCGMLLVWKLDGRFHLFRTQADADAYANKALSDLLNGPRASDDLEDVTFTCDMAAAPALGDLIVDQYGRECLVIGCRCDAAGVVTITARPPDR
jgi:hypothetical protein